MTSNDSFRNISTCFLPSQLTPDHNVNNSIVVLIRHRMCATLVTALGEGATGVRLFKRVAYAKRALKEYSTNTAVLCGEHNRMQIPGFDLDNSPPNYNSFTIGKKTILAYTSNGTRALPWVRNAKLLVLASFLNISAVVQTLSYYSECPIIFLCAGIERCTKRAFEDEVCAAYIIYTFLRSNAKMNARRANQSPPVVLDTNCLELMSLIFNKSDYHSVCSFFKSGETMQELINLGLEKDVDWCLQLDKYSSVLPYYLPRLDTFLSYPCHLSLISYPVVFPINNKAIVSQNNINISLILIRHGSYDTESVRGMVGRLNPSLSPIGIQESHKLAHQLNSHFNGNLSRLFCSPLKRTLQTSAIIANKFNNLLMIETDINLVAIDRGDWQGLSPDEVNSHFPGGLEGWSENLDYTENGGESFSTVTERVGVFLEKIDGIIKNNLYENVEESKVNICITAHYSTVCSILHFLQNMPASEWGTVNIPPASYIEVKGRYTHGDPNILWQNNCIRDSKL